MGDQLSIFDFMRQPIKIDKPIRLIELFAGYGSQAMALKRLGADFETYKVVEFDKYAIASYNAIHGTDFPTIDINNVKGEDLQICDKEDYTYLLTPFHAQIYLLQEGWKEWQRIPAPDRRFFGRSEEY